MSRCYIFGSSGTGALAETMRQEVYEGDHKNGGWREKRQGEGDGAREKTAREREKTARERVDSVRARRQHERALGVHARMHRHYWQRGRRNAGECLWHLHVKHTRVADGGEKNNNHGIGGNDGETGSETAHEPGTHSSAVPVCAHMS
jgi:hypothetical protein